MNVLPSQSGPMLPEPYEELMVEREGGREGGVGFGLTKYTKQMVSFV